MPAIRPWASGERTKARCRRPGSARLPTKVLAPVIRSRSSTRRTAVPKIDPGMCPAYVRRVLDERQNEGPTTDRKKHRGGREAGVDGAVAGNGAERVAGPGAREGHRTRDAPPAAVGHSPDRRDPPQAAAGLPR